MTTLMNYLAELVHAQLEDRIPSAIPESISIDSLRMIAHRHHMNSILLGSLLKLDLDENIKASLRAQIIPRIISTHSQRRYFNLLINSFEEKQIVTQPMKGIFMQDLFSKPELREMSDLDIFIDDTNAPKAKQVLSELGFAFCGREAHHDIYKNKENIIIEAHWTLYDGDVDRFQHDYFNRCSSTILLDGHKYTHNFNPEDFYIFMLSHMAKHFYKMGCGIRNLVDIYVFKKHYAGRLDEKYIKNELKTCGIYQFAHHMEKLADIWLNNLPCDEFYLNTFNYMLDCGIYGKDEYGIWNKYATDGASGKKVSRFRLKLWYYFPPMYYMVDWYPWLSGKPFLLPVAWIIRAVTGLVNNKGIYKREFLKTADVQSVRAIQEIYIKMALNFTKH